MEGGRDREKEEDPVSLVREYFLELTSERNFSHGCTYGGIGLSL